MSDLMKGGIVLVAGAVMLLIVGCNVTLPKVPDWKPDVPAVVTNVVILDDIGITVPPIKDDIYAPTEQVKDDIDLSTVQWHGQDIRAWPIAAELVAGVRGGEITLVTDLLKGKAQTGDNGTTGNAWAITQGTDGKLHAYSYEWIDFSRQSRSMWKAFDRDHGCPSVCTNAGFKGAVFYVAVATVSRGGKKSNGDVRTGFKTVVHP